MNEIDSCDIFFSRNKIFTLFDTPIFSTSRYSKNISKSLKIRFVLF